MPLKRAKNLKVILYDPSGSGGVCHYTHQLADSLAKAGNEVIVATTESYELLNLPRSFRLHFLFRKSRLKERAARVVLRLCRRSRLSSPESHPEGPGAGKAPNPLQASWLAALRLWYFRLKAIHFFLKLRPDIIHVQWLLNAVHDFHFLRLLKWLGFRLVYTAHDLLPHENRSPRIRRALGRIYRLVDGVVVHANSNKEELTRLLQVDPARVFVIPHGSYDFFFGQHSSGRAALRAQLGFSEDRKVILFFGIIRRYKGLECLVEAFNEVRRARDDAALLIVGKIYEGDPEGFQFYQSLLRELQGREDVRCIPEYVPLESVGDYFSASDLVVLPYTKTYQSGVLLSAYAAGRPVVVTDTGGLSEVVVPGSTGYVIPPGDARALAAAILRVLQDPEQMKRMGEEAGHLARTRYSWRNVAGQTENLYRLLAVQESRMTPLHSAQEPL